MSRTEEQEWIALTLKEYERNRCVAKVLEVQSESATSQGDHYGSSVRRVKLRVMLHSGEVETRTFFLKCMPEKKETRELIIASNMFVNEKWMFSEILPAMERIVQLRSPGSELVFARLIGKQGNEKLLLEDLKPLGYKLIGHRKGLDFDHCSILMEALGKFHALSAMIIQEGVFHGDDTYSHYYEKRREYGEKIFSNTFKEAAWIMENKWKGEWVDLAKRMRVAADVVGPQQTKLFVRDEERFNLLLHGDLWFNNLMFKYNENGKPVAVRLMDFQIPWYNSVGFDLNYFLWTSLHTDVRPRKPELLRLYHESLSRSLRLYGYDKEPPSLEELLAEVDRTALFGFIMSVYILEFMMQPSTETPDVEKLMQGINTESKELTFINRNKKEGEDYRRTLQYIIKEAAEIGLI